MKLVASQKVSGLLINGRLISLDFVKRVGEQADMPFVVGGGISASSQELLLHRFQEFALLVKAEPVFEFLGTQDALGLHRVFLAVNPFGFNGIEPGAFHRQAAHQQTATALGLDAAIVGFEPICDLPTHMPTGIIPEQQQDAFALGG